MKKQTLVIGAVVIVGVVILLAYGVFKVTTTPGKYDGFAQCLTEKGVVMYGTDWCPHCQNQKDLFGKKSFKYVNYKNCNFEKELCLNKGIRGYPTWIIDGEKYPGTQSLKELAELSGCNL